MVSTRQSSNISSSGENAISETGGIKTRHNLQNSTKVPPTTSVVVNGQQIPQQVANAEHNSRQSTSHAHILDLPQEIFDKIFSYVGYKNVSQMRLVCRQFNSICSSTLNSTFQRLQNQMLLRFQGIKAKMPRRESARRNHPLACESDIVETLHMRLTLLQMSFGKHIERKHCCFFAGEILDEVYRILHYIKVTPKLTRPYRVTDELFDLSSMAMEYFKEHIEPTLPEISYFSTDFLDFSTNGLSSTGAKKTWIMDSPPHTSSSKVEYEPPAQGEERPPEQSPQPQSVTLLRKRMRKMKISMKKYNSQLALYKRELKSCKAKLAEQQKKFMEMASRMDDNDKKNDETARKFSTLLQELNKCKTELQYWRSKSPLLSLCPACSQNIGGGLMEGLMVGGVVGGWGMEGGGGVSLEGPSDLILDQQPPQQVAPISCPALPETPAPTPQPDPLAATTLAVSNKRKSLADTTPYVLPKKSKKSRLKPMLKASQRTRRS